ncbi:putative F-box protein [Raphanus sativus]|uniref:Probable F-box protein At5g47300 n=1 Tax=Raphanus sativus TaxID=3726 RepID=A0A6J0P0C0_RAPSA|nr:probable F-box protein At5g47300 [Raphanus sativus]KAJ4894465.1 putative F-box protein [Raphanus sativus]
MDTHSSVSLKGKTYWFALDEKELGPVALLVSFDYTTEKFARLCLPNPYGNYRIMSLSVVREEKLSVLLRHRDAFESETEIWVSNPIDEHKVVSWSMILVWDEPRLGLCRGTSFLVDEEKKIALCCDRGKWNQDNTKAYFLLYIIGEDNKLTQVDFSASSTWQLHSPLLFNYVPSLVRIQ